MAKDLRDIKIETTRLSLQSVTADYVEDIFTEYRGAVIKYMNYGPPENVDILRDRFKDRVQEMKQGLQLFLVVLDKNSREFLGCFAIEDLSQTTPEMGGWLKASAHGRAYGREAAAALKKWADQNLDYDYILWPCAAENFASRKLAESLGGQIAKEYMKKTQQGAVWPYVQFRITRR